MAKNESSKKTIVEEFKTFISRGNVIDMAVGVVIGGMFTKIVNSLVQDILNPIIGFILGNVDFTDLKIVLKEATDTTTEVAVRYGNLIQSVVQFLLTAIVMFAVIKAINKFKEAQEELAKKLERSASKKKNSNEV